MDTIKTILEGLFKEEKLDQVIKVCRVFEVWNDAVGPRTARHSQPKRFHDHVLWVTVDNSTWMQELKFLEAKIRDQMNQHIGAPVIEKIRFQLGEITSSCNEMIKSDDAPAWHDIEIDESVRKDIEKEVAVLKDEGVKARLRSLFQKHAQLETYRGRK
jgi:hypothetical protein